MPVNLPSLRRYLHTSFLTLSCGKKESTGFCILPEAPSKATIFNRYSEARRSRILEMFCWATKSQWASWILTINLSVPELYESLIIPQPEGIFTPMTSSALRALESLAKACAVKTKLLFKNNTSTTITVNLKHNFTCILYLQTIDYLFI